MTTTLRIRALTEMASGPTLTQPATAWGYSQWKVITSNLPSDVYITHISFQETKVTTADTTYQLLIEIGVGAAGYEVVKIQFPYSFRSDTAAGYYYSTVTHAFPEPMLVPIGSTISVRYAGSAASADVIGGVKIQYLSDVRATDSSAALKMENFKYFSAGTGMSIAL